jgi:hypothetical protein
MVEQVLSGYGLAGAVIFVLGGVVVWQQNRYDKLLTKNEVLQEKRYMDLMELKDKQAEVMSGFSQTADLLYNKLTAKG